MHNIGIMILCMHNNKPDTFVVIVKGGGHDAFWGETPPKTEIRD